MNKSEQSIYRNTSAELVARLGLNPDEFRIRTVKYASGKYAVSIVDMDKNDVWLLSLDRTLDIARQTAVSYVEDILIPTMRNRPLYGFAGQFSSLKVVRAYGEADVALKKGGCVVDFGINFLVLTAQALGIPMLFSCEGHPGGLYAKYVPVPLCLELERALLETGTVIVEHGSSTRIIRGPIEGINYAERNAVIDALGEACEQFLRKQGIEMTRDSVVRDGWAAPVVITQI